MDIHLCKPYHQDTKSISTSYMKAKGLKCISTPPPICSRISISFRSERKRMSILVGQLETDVEIKAPADKFHDVYSRKPHHISNVTPGKIQSVDLHEGEWEKPGRIVCWNYMHDGVAEVAKEVVEAIDDEKYSTTFRVIEGHLLEKYKNFYLIVQATPKDGGSLVHWTLKYEKASEDVPEPKGILQLAIDVTKDLDAHLTEQA